MGHLVVFKANNTSKNIHIYVYIYTAYLFLDQGVFALVPGR